MVIPAFAVMQNQPQTPSNPNTLLPPILTGNLVGYWSLDEGIGTSAYDLSGNGNTGTLVNSPTWQSGSNCKFGSCLNLVSASSQYVSIGTTPNPSGSFTLTAWINIASTGSTLPIMNKGFNFAELGFTMRLSNHHLECGMQNGGYIQQDGTRIIDDNAFHLLSCVFTSGASMAVYVDGALDTSGATAVVGSANANTLFIGHDDAGNYWNGKIDDARIYNVALAVTQIAQLYSYGLEYHN